MEYTNFYEEFGSPLNPRKRRKLEEFLAKHIDFTLERFSLPLPIGACNGHLTLWPQRYGTDGFYTKS